MKNKKILFMLILIIIILGVIAYFIFNKVQENKPESEITEYIPEEEIDEKRIKTNSGVIIF